MKFSRLLPVFSMVILQATGMAFLNNANASSKEVSMKNSVSTAISLDTKNKTVTPLFNEGFKVVGLGFKKNQVLEKHDTPTPAFLLVQEGEVDFIMGKEKFRLKAGDFFKIPAKQMHEIVAVEDSKLLLMK